MSDSPAKQGENRDGVGPGKPPPEHRFQPGQSGNPTGRPKGSVSLVALLRRKLAEPGDDGKQNAEAIIDAMIRKARCGEFKEIKEMLDRIDGKVSDAPDSAAATPEIDPAVAAAMRAAGLAAAGSDPAMSEDAGEY